MNNGSEPPNHSVVCKSGAAYRNGRAEHITAAIIHGVMIEESICSGFWDIVILLVACEGFH
jgi:hypothetical protein